jgi:hypothetical protein
VKLSEAQEHFYVLMAEAKTLSRAQADIAAKRQTNLEARHRLLRQFPTLYFDRESAQADAVPDPGDVTEQQK